MLINVYYKKVVMLTGINKLNVDSTMLNKKSAVIIWQEHANLTLASMQEKILAKTRLKRKLSKSLEPTSI